MIKVLLHGVRVVQRDFSKAALRSRKCDKKIWYSTICFQPVITMWCCFVHYDHYSLPNCSELRLSQTRASLLVGGCGQSLTFPCIIMRTVSRLTGTLSLRTIFFSLAMSRWKKQNENGGTLRFLFVRAIWSPGRLNQRPKTRMKKKIGNYFIT